MTYGIGIGNAFCTEIPAMFEFRSLVTDQGTIFVMVQGRAWTACTSRMEGRYLRLNQGIELDRTNARLMTIRRVNHRSEMRMKSSVQIL